MIDHGLALRLTRRKLAFTVSFHFLFPAFSIRLASYLAVLLVVLSFFTRPAVARAGGI